MLILKSGRRLSQHCLNMVLEIDLTSTKFNPLVNISFKVYINAMLLNKAGPNNERPYFNILNRSFIK